MTTEPTGVGTVAEDAAPSPATLRVGVVGVGARSTILAHAELPHNDAQVVAACDPRPEAEARLRDWTRIDPAGVVITDNLDAFIAVGLDAAVVTSPDDTHAEITCRLLDAGIPVYLEKPMAIELDGATRILQTAYDTGTRLYVGHNMRHMSVVRTMRDIIRRGEIGAVKAIWCRHFVGEGGDYYFKDWHADRRYSNGLLLQKAAHDIDVMNWLADSHATRVVGMGGLTVYGDITDRQDRSDKLMWEWYNVDNWPPLTQKGLNPVVDVEDLSMFSAKMAIPCSPPGSSAGPVPNSAPNWPSVTCSRHRRSRSWPLARAAANRRGPPWSAPSAPTGSRFPPPSAVSGSWTGWRRTRSPTTSR